LPLPLPNLDDRTWKDLVAEGRALIPAMAPEWTDHNPSDPGITLVELFAFLSEILIYRLNRIDDRTMNKFLKLINGPDWRLVGELDAARRSTLMELATIRRAVTAQDFEHLAHSVNQQLGPAHERVGRVNCVLGQDLQSEWAGSKPEDTSADVSVVVLSTNGREPSPELLHEVRHVLEGVRMLCTRVHVMGPRYVTVGVRASLALRPNFSTNVVHERALQALRHFFDPLKGGFEGQGWPFGRGVYVSEIYHLLLQIDGVDRVMRTSGNKSAKPSPDIFTVPKEVHRVVFNRLDEVEAIDLGPGELVDAQIAPENIKIVTAEES
jgi:Baseplate J-like protein